MTRREERVKIYSKFDGHCSYCGEEIGIKEMQVDHVVPRYGFVNHIHNKWQVPKFLSHLTIYDKEHMDNKFPTCRVCNKWKSSFHLELFRSEVQLQLLRVRRQSSNYRMCLKYHQVVETPREIVFYFENE